MSTLEGVRYKNKLACLPGGSMSNCFQGVTDGGSKFVGEPPPKFALSWAEILYRYLIAPDGHLNDINVCEWVYAV